MSKLKCFAVVKIIIIILILSISFGDIGAFAQLKENPLFNKALVAYNNGDFNLAREHLEEILNTNEKNDLKLKAKVYFLLGACHERQKNKTRAKEYFLKLREMFENDEINGFSTMEGIEPNSFSTYKKVFKSYFKKKEKEKKAAENMIVKQGEKKKKKKKGSIAVLVAAGVAVVVAIAMIAFKKKKDEKPSTEVEFESIQWMRVPAGEFLMGDNFNQGKADDLPVHNVYLDEYYISRFEITGAQFRAYLYDVGKLMDSEYSGSGDYPVSNITWEEANEFCQWLSNKTGENVKLPTEAQWEKAARGTDQRKYPWGNESPTCDYANIGICGSKKKIVGSAPNGRSPYGAEDMIGNVSEWCRDWYDESYYSASTSTNPQGPESGMFNVVRGGAWWANEMGLQITSFDRDYYDFVPPKSDIIGFRVVKE